MNAAQKLIEREGLDWYIAWMKVRDVRDDDLLEMAKAELDHPLECECREDKTMVCTACAIQIEVTYMHTLGITLEEKNPKTLMNIFNQSQEEVAYDMDRDWGF